MKDILNKMTETGVHTAIPSLDLRVTLGDVVFPGLPSADTSLYIPDVPVTYQLQVKCHTHTHSSRLHDRTQLPVFTTQTIQVHALWVVCKDLHLTFSGKSKSPKLF